MAIDQIIIQGETFTHLGAQGTSPNLIRTRTQNQESASPTPPQFDQYGLRPDYSGNGYYDINGSDGGAQASASFEIPEGEAGTYSVTLRLANGGTGSGDSLNRPITVTIGTTTITIPGTNTGQWYHWELRTAAFDLEPGVHQIVIGQVTTAGAWAPNIDAIAIHAPDVVPNFFLPAFTTPTTFMIDAGDTAVGTVAAQDTANDTSADAPARPGMQYAIAGGADADAFAIDPATGALSLLEAADKESYQVVVAATDAEGGVTEQAITVDVAFPGGPFETTYLQAEDGAAGPNNLVGTNISQVRDASNMEIANGVAYLRPDHSGTGYVDYGSKAGDSFTYAFDDGEGGARVLHVRYASNGVRPLEIVVNGVSLGTQSFASTDPDGAGPEEGFDHWVYATFDITTAVGANSVTLRIPTGGGNAPNVDAIAIAKPGEIVSLFAPEIAGDGAFAIDENTTAVGQVAASDLDGNPLTYELSGADAAHVSIDANGNLTLNAAPDFENPQDDDGDGTFEVTVTVSDGVGSVAQDVTIAVQDLAELPEPAIAPIVLQAEAAALQAGADTFHRVQNDPSTAEDPVNNPRDGFGLRSGYSGWGYSDFGGSGSGGDETLTWTVEVAEAGAYALHVRYASTNAGGDLRPLDLLVNGAVQQVALPFPGDAVGGFAAWLVRAPIQLVLEAGENTITFAVPAGFSNGPNIDAVALTSVGAAAPAFPATNSAPAFDSAPDAITVDEGATGVIGDFGASDGQGDALGYSLTGADAEDFTISATGELSFAAAPDFEAPADADGDNAYQVTVVVSDGVLSTEQDVTVTVADLDDEDAAPTAITLTAVAFDENVAGAVVAAVAVTDPDSAYVAADLALGGADAALFRLIDGETGIVLALAEGVSLDFEAATQPSVTVTLGSVESDPFTPAPSDVDEDAAPTAIALTAIAVAENVAGAVVAEVAVADPDTVYAAADLGLEGPDAALFELVDGPGGVIQLKLLDGVALDFEAAAPSVTVTLGGLTSDPFSPTVTDVAEDSAPTAIALTAIAVAENVAGAVVAEVAVTDPDSVYAAADLGLDGPDAELFELVDGPGGVIQLKLLEGVALDFEAAAPSVTVTLGGLTSDPFSPTVTDVAEDAAPTAIALTAIAVAENEAGAVVAEVAVADPDSVYAAADLGLDGPDAELFELVDGPGGVIQLKLLDGVALDFEAAAPSVTITLGSLSSDPFSPTVTDVVDPVAVRFDAGTLVAYDEGQDQPEDGGSVQVSGDGGALMLHGNLWKRAPLDADYTITADTRITVDIAIGSPQPEIIAVGFDDDDNPFETNDNSNFQLGGSQRQANFIDLRGQGVDQGGGVLRFTLDLSAHAGKTIDSLTFIADDDAPGNGLGSVTFSNVTIFESEGVDPDNSAPREVGGGVPDLTVDEGATIEIDLPFVDDDGDAISFGFSLADANGDPVAVAGLAIEDGVLTGPVPTAPGTYTVTLTAHDGVEGHLPTESVFLLTVSNTNDAPVASDPALEPFFLTAGQQASGIDLAQFEGYFTDPDGDPLALSAEGLPAGLSVNEEGVIVGTPLVAGDFTVTIRATDPSAASATLTIDLSIDGPEIGDVVVVEAEAFTGLGSATNFVVAGQATASGDQIVRAATASGPSLVTTDLSQNGLVEGWYTVAMTRYDETDGSASYSLSIGDTVLAQNDAFDAGGSFDNSGPRGVGGQAGNLKTITFDTPVFVTAGTILTLSGQSNSENLRTDKFTFTRVAAPNEAPSAPALDVAAVAENAAGAVVGTLSATDPDGDPGAITYSVDPASDFEVVGSTLKLKDGVSLDHEAAATVEVAVTATDASGAATTVTLAIAVEDVDEAPSAPVITSASVDENDDGAVIGTVSSIDPEGTAVSFTVSDARFEIDGDDQLALRTGESLDHEAGGSVAVEVTATDETGQSVTGTIVVTVNDVNEAPTLGAGATLDDVAVANGAGATIDLSVLGATDPDEGDAPGYAISSATPLPDGFAVVGTDLIVPADAPAGSYEITVFATDGELDSESVSFTVTVGEAAPFETLILQGEDLTVVNPGGDTAPNLIRTQTQNWERDGSPNNPEPNATPANPNDGTFDAHGLRPGYSGTGYFDINGSDTGLQATASFTAPAGTYEITVRLANGAVPPNPRPLTFTVDGVANTIADTYTGEFFLWETRTFTVTLTEDGTHTLAIAQDTAAGAPNIDAIAIALPGTPVDFLPDTSADEDGDFAAAPEDAAVAPDELGAVTFRLSGVDPDIVAIEVSTDGGATFTAVTATADGADFLVTLDLSAFAAEDGAEARFRLTDDAGNSVTETAAITIGDAVAPITIQAEDAVIDDIGEATGVTVVVSPTNPDAQGGYHAGAFGEAYVDFGADPGDSLTFTVDAEVAGTYLVSFRYANGAAPDRPLDLSVNGGAAASLGFPATGAWTTWSEATVEIELAAGSNTVRLAIPAGATTGPNVDQAVFTLVTPAIDDSADEDGNLALSVAGVVDPDDLGAVAFTLAGVDADIVGYEVSTDGGATFVPVAVTGGVATLDLSAFAAADSVSVTFRLTDDAGNTVDRTATIAIEDDPVAFSQTIQLESRAGDVTIADTTPGTNGNSLTQPRDPANPEAPTAANPDGLWDGFNGEGYLDMGSDAGDAFSFQIDAPAGGTYSVTFRYANGGTTGDRPMTLSIGGTVVETIGFGQTGDWDQWTEVTVDVTLAAGANTITLANVGTAGPNLDQVTVTNNVEPVDPGSQPGPRETIKINFQDGATPKVEGYLVGNFENYGDQGNGHTYGFVTEASALDADGTSNTPVGDGYPAIAVNERTGTGTLVNDGTLPAEKLTVNFDNLDPRLTGYAHFDLSSFPGRTAWEIELEDGWYEVTVSVGDTGGANDSVNRLFIEGELATEWTPTSAFKTELVTKVVKVVDGHLTLSAQGGTTTEMQYLEIRALPDLTPDDGNEAPEDYAAFTTPRAVSENGDVALGVQDGELPVGIDPTSDIVLGVAVVEGRGGALLASLDDGSIRLYETLTGIEVPYHANTTGGFDSLTIAPTADLKPFTSYTLVIDGFRDRGSNDDVDAPTREFQKFSTTFVTGAAPVVEAREVAFVDTVELTSNAALGEQYTSIEMSPDKAFLYVTSLSGTITRWAVDPETGALDQASKEIFAPGGDFNAADGRRGIIGIAFDPEDPDVIWITDNYPVPLNGRANSVPDFSGRISKVTLGPDGSLEDATISTYLTGLPRSNGDHVTNSLEFRANPNAGQAGEPDFLLYLTQGSNSAMGQPDSAWGLRPERLLNAAILEIDHTRTPPSGGFDVSTEPLPADGNNRRFADSDGDLKNGGIAITSGQYNGNFLHFTEEGVAQVRTGSTAASALVTEFYNPFEADAVLKIFATGNRNAYDLVWHSNGYLYVPTNGSAAGGNVPNDPDTAQNENVNNVGVQPDYLFRMIEGGYYGHPNPVRDNFILNGGNPTSGTDPNEVTNYPVGTQPDPDYDLEGSYSLQFNKSPNGAIEYVSGIFGSSLQKAVIFTQYSSGDNLRAVLLNADGTVAEDFILRDTDGNIISYVDPLDVIEGADGRLYMLTLNRGNGVSQIIRLDAAPGGEVADNTADAGGDLALVVVNATDPANVIFQVNGLDADIQTITVSFNGGAAQTVTLNGQGRFTVDLSGETGAVSATLVVADDDGNTASKTTGFTLGSTSETVIDAVDFTVLPNGSGTLIRRIDDEATHETGSTTDLNGDGLNDNYDGLGYLDPNGGAGDKASFTYTAAVAGTYSFVFRMANGSAGAQARPIAIKVGDQTVEIANTNTGSFSTWQDFPVTLELPAGTSTIVIAQTGTQGGPNVDSVTVTLIEATDVTADEGGDLALAVVDASDPSAVVFEVTGLDDDIETITVSFDGGATTQTVALDGQGRFTADVGGASGPVTATLVVEDGAGNDAAAEVSFTPGGATVPNDGEVTVGGVVYVVYEAENAALGGAPDEVTTAESDRGQSGGAFVDFLGPDTETVTWTIEVGEDGTYGLDILYALGAGKAARPMTLAVDGVEVGTLAFVANSNAAESIWGPQSSELTLTAGVHTITVTAPGGVGPNVDLLRITKLPVDAAPDTDADLGDDLSLVVLDAGDPAAVLFQVTGLDSDIETITVSFDGGATTQTVTLDGAGQFTADVGGTGEITAILTVTDDDGNVATDETTFVAEAPSVPNDGTETVSGVVYTIYEAENADLDGPVVVSSNDPGGDRNQRGDEFVDFDGTGAQTITWTVSVPQGGLYGIDILYALGAGKAARPAELTVNGQDLGDLAFAANSNAGETVWGPQSAEVQLSGGLNTISITVPNANGANIDYLRVSQQPIDAFDPTYAEIDGSGRIELEATDGTARTVSPSAVEFYFTVEADGTYALDLAANAGAPDGAGVTLLLSANGGLPVEIDDGAFPGAGDAGETTAFVELAAGVAYRLTVVSDQPGASALDYLDVRVAPGDPNADIGIQSQDPAYFDNRLHFSFLNNPFAVVPDQARDFKESGTVVISNTGSSPLEFIEASLTGPFELADPDIFDGLVLAAGQSIEVEVLYDNAAHTPPASSNVNGVFKGALTLRTNDADTPVATVDLAGFWQAQDESGQEPNVNEIWEVFGFGNRIEGLTYAGGGENSTLNFHDVYLPVDETEVMSPYWRLADGATSARITQITAFHSPSGATIGIHQPGSTGGGITFTNHASNQNQTILPLLGNGNFASTVFTNGTIPDGWAGNDLFGITVAGLSTDPRLNPTGSSAPSQAQLDALYPGYTVVNGVVFDPEGNEVPDGYTVRIFQAVDVNGDPIENVFLGIMDYTGINYDYNDNMFIIEGVTPAYFGAVMRLSGLDDAAADDRLVFSRIDNPANGNQTFRDQATITVTNDGISPLTIEDIAISGPFQIVSGPADGSSVAVGASVTVTIAFTGTDPSDNNQAVSYDGALSISTSAGDRTVALSGIAQIQSEGGEEPTVQQIVEAFGYSTDVAESLLANGGTVETVGDEVLLPYLQRLDGSKPVEVIQLAAYMSSGVGRLQIHDVASGDLTQLYVQDDNQYQSLLPDGHVSGPGNTGVVARATIDRDEPFGLKVTVDNSPTFSAWTDPNANVADETYNLPASNGGHYIRFFQAIDADGRVIAGTYIGIQDYPGASNFDYNDHVFLIKNVQAYALSDEEDANGDGVNDALVLDDDNDGTPNFFDPDFTTPAGPQTAFNATETPWAVDDDGLTLAANLFDNGGQGVAYNDGTTAHQGANFRPNEAVDISNGTLAIGYTQAGEWVEYTINVEEAGEYTLTFNASSPINGRILAASFAQGGVVYEDATANVPNTGAYTSYVNTAPQTVTLSAGVQVLRVTFVTDQQDLMSFTLTPVEPTPSQQTPFPGPNAPTFAGGTLTVDASNYDNGGQGVAYNDAPGLQGGTNGGRAGSAVEQTATGHIGWIENGEWLEYTINVPAAGTYDIDLLLATPEAGRSASVAFHLPGAATPYAASGPIANPSSGSYTSFQPRSADGIELQAGTQVIRVTFNGGSQDFSAFTITQAEPENQAPVTSGISGAPGAEEGTAYSFDVSGAFSDPDAGDSLTFTATGLPGGLSITPAGMITGTPTADGTFTVTVTASDGEASVQSSFTLSVTAEPVDPQQTPFPGPNAPTFAGGTLTVDASNYDNGGQGIAYNDAAGLQGGTNGGRAGSAVEQTPAGDIGWVANGEWLEYTINVPSAGLYDLDLLLATNGGGGRSATVSFYQVGASTPYLSTGPIANPSTGSWTNFQARSADGIALQAGTQVVRVTLNGGSQDFRSFTLTQQQAPENAAPVAGSLAGQSGDEGAGFLLDVAGAFSDPDGDALTFTATGLPAGLSISSAGVITGTMPQVSADTPFNVTVTATDPDGLAASASFTLTVEDVPAATPQTPFPGPNAPVIGAAAVTVDATNYDNGGQGVSWNDNAGRDGGNTFRGGTDVELVGAENDIGHVLAGEWVEYTVNVTEAGTYALSLNAKTPIGGNSVTVTLDDGTPLATFALADSNGASTSFTGTTFGSTAPIEVDLAAGLQTLRFTFGGAPASNGYLLDFRSFTLEQVEDETPVPTAEVIGQAGNVTFTQGSASQWFTVTFAEALDNPAVIMGPLSRNGADPATVRVRNVTDTGFQFQLDEWDYLDGQHGSETVSWVAIESGTHTLANGQVVRAGTTTVANGAASVGFGGSFAGTPTVFAQVTSTNDPDAVVDRIRTVSTSGFTVGLDEQEANAGVHGTESLAWIAMSRGGSVASGSVAGATGNAVTQAQSTINLGGTFADQFVFLADMQTENGNDPSSVRLAARTQSSATVFIEEERSNDNEMGHGAETVGWAALDVGQILAFDDLV